MQAFLDMQDKDDTDRVNAIRSDLGKYCKLDTLTTARILEKLESKSRRSHEPNKAT